MLRQLPLRTFAQPHACHATRRTRRPVILFQAGEVPQEPQLHLEGAFTYEADKLLLAKGYPVAEVQSGHGVSRGDVKQCWSGWAAPPDKWESITFSIKWMKISRGLLGATIRQSADRGPAGTAATFSGHPWALRIACRTAQVACCMWGERQKLRKRRGRAGWGTLYLLQRLGEEGNPEPHYKVGMTMGSVEVRRQAIAGQTMRGWRVLRTWRSQFAPVVERLVHLQLRRYRAYPGSARREWYDVHDVRVILLAVEDMLAAAQFLYVDTPVRLAQAEWSGDFPKELIQSCGLLLPDSFPEEPIIAECIAGEAAWAAAAAHL